LLRPRLWLLVCRTWPCVNSRTRTGSADEEPWLEPPSQGDPSAVVSTSAEAAAGLASCTCSVLLVYLVTAWGCCLECHWMALASDTSVGLAERLPRGLVPSLACISANSSFHPPTAGGSSFALSESPSGCPALMGHWLAPNSDKLHPCWKRVPIHALQQGVTKRAPKWLELCSALGMGVLWHLTGPGVHPPPHDRMRAWDGAVPLGKGGLGTEVLPLSSFFQAQPLLSPLYCMIQRMSIGSIPIYIALSLPPLLHCPRS